MKCILSKESLHQALQTVLLAADQKTTMPVLSNTLIQAKDGKISLTATDLDNAIKITIDGTVEKPGATTLPARRLSTVVRELPTPELAFTVDSKNNATIESGQATFKILGLPEEEFPPFPTVEGSRTYTLTQKTLREMIRKTSYAMASDDTRRMLMGTLFSFQNGKLTLVATDGKRLALTEHEMEITKSQELDIIVPSKAIRNLETILSDSEAPLTLTVADEKQIAFSLGNTILVTKLVEGKYPNYRQVIPTEAKERVIIDREHFLNALRRVSCLAPDLHTAVRLTFTKNKLELSTHLPDVGEAKETIALDYKGKDFAIAFNPVYLMEPVRNLDTETLFFDYTDELSPGVIKHSKPFLYVIMPIRSA
ncbi:MAG: DNA polymerase III subunit beta [Methylacidiphilales bacterium]|nr:DNA polymerase III subunit beta [Candidatus Methylacidiphilales bacterium]MDW8349410.1 DNA polymerase III subunit beta [Verrucomicrobiae bacterium]